MKRPPAWLTWRCSPRCVWKAAFPSHVQAAKQAGASRQEVISAILIGLPAAGNAVTQVLPTALATYDAA